MSDITVYRADFFDVLERWDGPPVDMVFADLPYGTTRNRWDTPIDLSRMWELLYAVTKPSAALVFTAQQPFTTTLIASNLRHYRYEWVWEKTAASGHLNAKKAPMKAHETVQVFYREQPTYNPQMTESDRAYSFTPGTNAQSSNYNPQPVKIGKRGVTTRYPRSVRVFGSVNNNANKRYPKHPTEKPVELVAYFVQTYTNPGDLVLDPTAGHLTTAVAAHSTGRRAIVIEQSGEYVSVGSTKLTDLGAEYRVRHWTLNPLASAGEHA